MNVFSTKAKLGALIFALGLSNGLVAKQRPADWDLEEGMGASRVVDSVDSTSSKKQMLIGIAALMYAGYLVYRYGAESHGSCFVTEQISPFTLLERR